MYLVVKKSHNICLKRPFTFNYAAHKQISSMPTGKRVLIITEMQADVANIRSCMYHAFVRINRNA